MCGRPKLPRSTSIYTRLLGHPLHLYCLTSCALRHHTQRTANCLWRQAALCQRCCVDQICSIAKHSPTMTMSQHQHTVLQTRCKGTACVWGTHRSVYTTRVLGLFVYSCNARGRKYSTCMSVSAAHMNQCTHTWLTTQCLTRFVSTYTRMCALCTNMRKLVASSLFSFQKHMTSTECWVAVQHTPKINSPGEL